MALRSKYLSWRHCVVNLFPNLNLADLTKLEKFMLPNYKTVHLPICSFRTIGTL